MTRTSYPRFTTTAAHEPIIAWTETEYTYCASKHVCTCDTEADNTECTCDLGDNCSQMHQGCDEENDRFAWWVNADKPGTYVPTTKLESLAYDLHELDESERWAYGEGTVIDLATGDELDITVFLARFAKPAW